jgi:D-3-phosphoglycerate dehydrogenase / 2-oxoglutarate reductase
VVANVPDFCTNELAEHTMSLLLAWTRQLPYMMTAVRHGNWSARHHPGVHRLAGQTLGLVGFGQSAAELARRARGFDLRIQAWVRDPAKYHEKAAALGVELVDFDRLLAEADILSLHVPLTPATRHLIGARELALMKPTALLVNTARGAIIDELALVEALRTHQIAGAALDVFEDLDVFAPPGPPPVHPLLELDNVILTPHSGGSSVESTRDSKVRGARNAADVLLGQWPRYVVNPEVKPRFTLR